ncbi:MAG: ABC transporter substrate-binding protein [Hyphomicrobiaceae bacterium]
MKIKQSGGAKVSRRKVLKTAGAAAAAGLALPGRIGYAKEFDGVTLQGASFSSTFFGYLKNYFPEFEEQTGMKVNFVTNAFPVFNQRTDLELSTKGSALDVINVTFIYSGRWIGAGWVENLKPYIEDPNLTPSDWDAADFVGGTMASLQDANGDPHGFPWEAGAMIMGASRADLIDKAGKKMPTTFDELIDVCDAIHGQGRMAAFTADKLHHWNWIPYLMGHGGEVFKDPPGNLTPTWNTPEAAAAADYYGKLLSTYGPSGILSFTDGQAMETQKTGRANIRTQAITWMVPLAKDPDSRVKDTVRYSLMPGGPAGNFPGSNSHGFGIPVGSKNKKAAWAFIKWAVGKQMTSKLIEKHGYPSVCRRSLIETEMFKEAMTLNGQDVASIYLQVLELGGKSGYMKYRTVPQFPQVGDKINKAIERVATRQQNGAEAMAQAQAEAVADLKKSGVKIDL